VGSVKEGKAAITSSVIEPAAKQTWKAVIAAYVGLTKPRIIELLLVTTIPAMFLAAEGMPPLGVAFWTLIGGTLAAGSANVFNSVLDSDIDTHMRRTRNRPMPQHKVGRARAVVFGVVLGIGSVAVLAVFTTLLAAVLALVANAYYVFVYTMGLKRRTSQNIVWGGIAGCFPPLIGWVAITGQVAWTPLVLFAIVFAWTPPHTWALAIRYKDDYAQAHVPMLPVVMPARKVTARILAYTVLTVLVSLLLWPVAPMGWLYVGVAALGGAAMIVEAVLLHRRALAGADEIALRPMRLFHLSNTYLALVFAAAAVDTLIR
jgi:protoheme IX farnesyltransferase